MRWSPFLLCVCIRRYICMHFIMNVCTCVSAWVASTCYHNVEFIPVDGKMNLTVDLVNTSHTHSIDFFAFYLPNHERSQFQSCALSALTGAHFFFRLFGEFQIPICFGILWVFVCCIFWVDDGRCWSSVWQKSGDLQSGERVAFKSNELLFISTEKLCAETQYAWACTKQFVCACAHLR